jgi:cell division protein FtsB
MGADGVSKATHARARATAGKGPARGRTRSSGKGQDGGGRQVKGRATKRLNRRQLLLAVTLVFALVVIGTSVPISGLLSQHRQLTSANAELHRLKQENAALGQEQAELNSKAEIHQLARQDYQLVDPGQIAYTVLPPGGQAGSSSSSGSVSDDPGNQAPVAPANALGMTPDPALPSTTPSSGTTSSGSAHTPSSTSRAGTSAPADNSDTSGSFWSRTVHSLEFWR